MLRLITFVGLITISMVSSASTPPERTLFQYFDMLTTQNYDGIADLMDPESMEQLKFSMDNAMKFQAQYDVYRLQERIFGERKSKEEIAATPPAVYLEALAAEILRAAQATHLVVADRKVIGKVAETDKVIHIVARLTFKQDSARASDVLVYTLVKRPGGWKLRFPQTIKQMLTVVEGTARQI